MKQKWVDAYMDTAERFAQLSSAVRLKVGTVIVKDHRIVSIGYNGTPAGWDNVCEDVIGEVRDGGGNVVDRLTKTKPEVIHSEMNSLLKLARDGESGKNATMFVTHAPCIECAKGIYGAGISHVYYRDVYRSDAGIIFLEKCGIAVTKL